MEQMLCKIVGESRVVVVVVVSVSTRRRERK